MDPRAQKISTAIQKMPANSARLSAMALAATPQDALREIQEPEHYNDYGITEAESKALTADEVKPIAPPLHLQAQRGILTHAIESKASRIAATCADMKELHDQIRANPQNYGLPTGLVYEAKASNVVPVTEEMFKKAQKLTLAAKINGLSPSPELKEIAECKDLDKLAELINSKKDDYGINKGAKITASELDLTLLQNAQAKVIPWMLKEIKGDDNALLIEVASSQNKANLATKLTKKFLKDATIEEKVLSDDIIKDAQIRVLRKKIEDLPYNDAHLREIASCQNPQAVATYLTGKMLVPAEIKPAVLSPTVVQDARKKVLSGLITALRPERPQQLEILTSIAKCAANPGALVTLINGAPTKFGFNAGTVITANDVPKDLIKDAKEMVAKIP